MKSLLFLASLGACVCTAEARVYSLNPAQTISFPEEGTAGAPKVAINDSSAIVLVDTGGNREARLYEREYTSGHWNFVRTLLSVPLTAHIRGELDMGADVAALLLDDELHIYERDRSTMTWFEAPTAGVPRGAGRISISNRRVFVGRVGCNAGADGFEKSRGSGVWRITARVAPASVPCADDGTDLDHNSPLVVAHIGDALRVYTEHPGELYWPQVATMTPPAGVTLGTAPPMMYGLTVVADGGAVFQIDPLDFTQWHYDGQVRTLDDANGTTATSLSSGETHVLSITQPGDFRQDARVDAFYNQVSSAPAGLRHVFSMFTPGSATNAHASGSKAIAGSQDRGGTRHVSFFDLPLNPNDQSYTDDFESPTPAVWSKSPDSAFALAKDNGNTVFRQSSLVGDAQASQTDTDWEVQQSIEADIKPTAIDGADRWVGLGVRYVDANNHYYVTLRSSNVLELKRKVNGVFTTLAQAPLPFALGATRHVKLIVNGDALTVFVDGQQRLTARDDALVRGRVALLTFKARADFDNVYASPTVPFNLAYKDFTEVFDPGRPFTQTGGSWTPVEGPDGEVIGRAQTSTAGDVRAIVGLTTDDQTVKARVRLDQFAASPQGAWFGLITRWRGPDQFYYLTVRSTNVLEIRKMVRGQITVLASVPFTAVPGRFYDLEFSALGDEQHAFVDGALVAQAEDGDIVIGQYGIGMYRTAATFQNFIVTQP